MVNTKSKKRLNKKDGIKLNSGVVIIIGVLCLLSIAFIGAAIMKALPDVSVNEIKVLSVTYKEQLMTYEASLKEQYLVCSTSHDVEAWEQFSQQWVSEISTARPKAYDLKLSKKSREIVNTATFMSRDLFQLWTEYNSALAKEEAIDPSVEKSLIDSLASGHAFLETALQ